MRTAAQKRVARAVYERTYATNHYSIIGRRERLTVPDNVQVLDHHTPCLKCGCAGPCKHRPWVS